MSFAFIEYADGSIDYQEDVIASWGEDGSLTLQEGKNYTWLNLGFAKSVRITEEPIEEVEFEWDSDEEDEQDGVTKLHPD